MQKRCINRRGRRSRQIGDMLLESMIAMGMVGIIAAGPAYITSKASVSQRQSNLHAQAVMQLRNQLQGQGSAMCPSTTSTITVGVTDLTVTPTCTELDNGATITIAGKTVELDGTTIEKRVSLSVTSAALFGGSGTIVVSQ